MREGVTYERFAAYVESRLENGGSMPSIREIVADLGGSATTVSRHRKRFLEARSEEQEAQIPEDIAAGIETTARRLAGTLWEQAQAEIAARKKTLDDREAEIEADAERRVAAATAALSEVRSALEDERTARSGRQSRRKISNKAAARRSARHSNRRLRMNTQTKLKTT